MKDQSCFSNLLVISITGSLSLIVSSDVLDRHLTFSHGKENKGNYNIYDNNHKIMLCDGWIFDSNHKHAIPFCQEGLNWCCSSKEKIGIYEWCPLLYKFEHNKIKHNK